MPSTEEKPVLKCDHILVSARGMFEMHGQKIIIFAPAAEIDRVTLKFGRSDHRPILSLAIGIILSVIGIYGVTELFLATRGYRYELAMIVLGAIGGSMIFDTLKQRYFLEVESKKGSHRLVFSKEAQLKDIQEFCNQVRIAYK